MEGKIAATASAAHPTAAVTTPDGDNGTPVTAGRAATGPDTGLTGSTGHQGLRSGAGSRARYRTRAART